MRRLMADPGYYHSVCAAAAGHASAIARPVLREAQQISGPVAPVEIPLSRAGFPLFARASAVS